MRYISFYFISVVINCGVTASVFLQSVLVVPSHNTVNRKDHKPDVSGALDSGEEIAKQHHIIFSCP